MKYVIKRIDRSGFNGDVAAFAFSGDAREYARFLSEQNPDDRFEVSEVLLWSVAVGKVYAENLSPWCAYVNGNSVKMGV